MSDLIRPFLAFVVVFWIGFFAGYIAACIMSATTTKHERDEKDLIRRIYQDYGDKDG